MYICTYVPTYVVFLSVHTYTHTYVHVYEGTNVRILTQSLMYVPTYVRIVCMSVYAHNMYAFRLIFHGFLVMNWFPIFSYLSVMIRFRGINLLWSRFPGNISISL